MGEPLETTYLPYNRWTEVLETLPVRFRKPYNARHSYTSWRLMIGHNSLLVAYEDGHSVATMERTYAAWTKGAKPEDVESSRMTAKDRPKVDPFAIQEAELIIAASHRMHGEWYGNYQEFLFFTALRHSEVFALEVDDCDLVNGKISITKAVVNGQPKNRTKTNQDREVNLCPRALQVLHAQLSLRAQMATAGMINHNRMFFTAVGEPFVNTFLPYRRWTEVLETLPLRYRPGGHPTSPGSGRLKLPHP